MRNIWKGLIVGGLTGAAVGIVADAGASGTQALGRAGREAQRHAVSGSDLLEDAFTTGVGKLEGANIPDRASAAAGRVAGKVNGKVVSAEPTNGRRR